MAVFYQSRLWSGNFFFPKALIIKGNEVIIEQLKWFGLRRVEERIPLSRIASVRTERGMLTTTIFLETAGGAAWDLQIGAVPTPQADEAVKLIRKAIS